MEAYWQALKHSMMSGSKHLSESEAAAYASSHLISDVVQRNIFDADDDKLFDANGNITANVRSGYDDLDWEDDVQRTGSRQIMVSRAPIRLQRQASSLLLDIPKKTVIRLLPITSAIQHALMQTIHLTNGCARV